MRRPNLFLLVVLPVVALAACDTQRIRAQPPDADFTARAVGFLDGLQDQSIRGNREFCGYFGYDDNGDFSASGPHAGGEYWCESIVPDDIEVVASYHTHGAHGHVHDAEVPSPDDVAADMAEGVFGYVATPGGRIWLIDWRTGVATQVCGAACVLQDPNYDAREVGPVARSYTQDSLADRFGL